MWSSINDEGREGVQTSVTICEVGGKLSVVTSRKALYCHKPPYTSHWLECAVYVYAGMTTLQLAGCLQTERVNLYDACNAAAWH